MKIYIQTLAGTTLALDNVDDFTLIESIQNRICREWGAPREQQRLMYNGVQLQWRAHISECRLVDFNIPSEATIRLTLSSTKRPLPPPISRRGEGDASDGASVDDNEKTSRHRSKKHSKTAQELQLKGISTADINDKDIIILGRGGMYSTTRHPGNDSFQNLIKARQEQYMLLESSTEKKEYATNFVQKLRKDGVRFLKKDDNEGKQWSDVGDVEMRTKVIQNLRDYRPKQLAVQQQSQQQVQQQRQMGMNNLNQLSPVHVDKGGQDASEPCSLPPKPDVGVALALPPPSPPFAEDDLLPQPPPPSSIAAPCIGIYEDDEKETVGPKRGSATAIGVDEDGEEDEENVARKMGANPFEDEEDGLCRFDEDTSQRSPLPPEPYIVVALTLPPPPFAEPGPDPFSGGDEFDSDGDAPRPGPDMPPSAGAPGMREDEDDEEDEENIGRKMGANPDDDESEDGGRRFGGQGMLPMPPEPEGVILRHIEREYEDPGEYDYPERTIGEFRNRIEDYEEVLDQWSSTPIEQSTVTTQEPHDAKAAILGISVHWLQNGFMKELHSAGLNDHSTIHEIEDLNSNSTESCVLREKGKSTMCPLDGRIGAAYVHCLENDADKVGVATHMLSYTWSYSIGDIVGALCDFCETHNLNLKRTYIWVDCFCINQHRVIEQKETVGTGMLNFEEEFSATLTGIGHMLAMMVPWHAPLYISRIWCVFEVFTAHISGCKIDIILPPSEKWAMAEVLGAEGTKGIECLYSALGNTRVENAMATLEKDRINILAMVERGPGYKALNLRVNDLLRQWVRETTIKFVQVAQRRTSSGTAPVGESNVVVGFPSSASEGSLESSSDLPVFSFLKADKQHAQPIDSSPKMSCPGNQSMANNTGIAQFVSNVGVLLHQNADTEQALECHKTALNLYSSVGTLPGTAEAHSNMGSALLSSGDLDGAFEQHQKSLEIRESAFGVESIEAAASLNNIATVMMERGNSGEALKYNEKPLLF